jgi:hypothetical protein
MGVVPWWKLCSLVDVDALRADVLGDKFAARKMKWLIEYYRVDPGYEGHPDDEMYVPGGAVYNEAEEFPWLVDYECDGCGEIGRHYWWCKIGGTNARELHG